MSSKTSRFFQPDDLTLVQAVSRGDCNAFWSLWQKHSSRLFAICLCDMRGNRADAEDALEQAMMKAYATLPRFAGRILSPAAWLTRLTRNLCRDIHRERLRNRRAMLQWKELIDAYARPDDDPAPVQELEIHPDSLARLLPPRLREAFILRVIHGMPYRAIASLLNVTCVTARKRVQQARAILRTARDEIHKREEARLY